MPPATRASLLGWRDPPAPTSMRTDCPGVTASCPAISAPGAPSDDPLTPPPTPTTSTWIWVAPSGTVHRVSSELPLVLEGRFAVTVRFGGDVATAGAAAAVRATGAAQAALRRFAQQAGGEPGFVMEAVPKAGML